jgi:hypothetical protein
MTVFRKVLQGLDLKRDAQATGYWHSWLFVLLTELDARETAHGTSDVLTDPYAECLRRLAAYSDTFAGQQLAALITSKVK